MNPDSHHNKQQQLADKDSALNDYFDVLLHEVTLIEVTEAVPPLDENAGADTVCHIVTESKFQIEDDDAAGQPLLSGKSEQLQNAADRRMTAVNIEADSTESGVSAALSQIGDEDNTTDVTKADDVEAEDYRVEGAPDWAQRPFQALEFSIAKLKLAIPLVHLCGILDWERAELTPMPGHSKHFIGVWPNHGTNSNIVDAAEMLVPERYHHKIEPWKERVSKVVLIDESKWGLACDEVLGVVTLDPRKVRWRTDRTRRTWLAGTLIEHMSALIDGDKFAAALLCGQDTPAQIAFCA